MSRRLERSILRFLHPGLSAEAGDAHGAGSTGDTCQRVQAYRVLILQHVHETDREHASPLGRSFESAFHPIVVVGLLVRHDDHLALAERQLVLVVCFAVVQGSTAS